MNPKSKSKNTNPKSTPTADREQALWAEGHELVCGFDEVGKGAWAGPLAVGIAVAGREEPQVPINDSKSFTEKQREEIFEEVKAWCQDWSVGFASPEECDGLGMTKAQELAAQRALAGLNAEPDWALVDGRWNFTGLPATETIIKGDAISLSIAAASILAKVTRDRLMRKTGDKYGSYRFAHNKGYRCPWHAFALQAWGATPIHRKTWSFMEMAYF